MSSYLTGEGTFRGIVRGTLSQIVNLNNKKLAMIIN